MNSDPKANTSQIHVLTSWKDFATYMGTGVRTVQRWEQDFAMPYAALRVREGKPFSQFRRNWTWSALLHSCAGEFF